MAKFFPALVLCLLGLIPPASNAEDLVGLLKRNCSVEEVKAAVDQAVPWHLNATDGDGRTALFLCRHPGTTLLLLAGADPNARDKDGRTPAFRVVSPSSDPAYPIMLELLALKGADVNACDKDGYTLLAWAAHEDNFAAARLLLLLGANPAPRDVPSNQTPLFFALQQHNDKLASLLISGSGPVPEAAVDAATKERGTPNERLAAAAQAAHLGAINDAIRAGADINARDKDGATALFRAVAERRANVAAFLLLKGANPNLAKNDGKTPLMQCVVGAEMASERMLVELILAGADVNAAMKDGSTALSAAVYARNNTAAQWLIWRGANLEVQTPGGTLAQIASLNADWPSMVELLKRAGVKEEASPLLQKKGMVLIDAVKAGNIQAVEAELNQGTPADSFGRHEQTALEWAVMYDQFEIADLLIRRGADINHQHSYNGEHVLHTLGGMTRAVSANSPELIEKVLKRGGNPNLRMKDGCTPLMLAARNGVTGRTVELLMQATADINARDKQSLTALGLARQHGHAETARMLAERGAVE